jgi:CRP/FNR family cyclic AMP-dependent transcriptional regulator
MATTTRDDFTRMFERKLFYKGQLVFDQNRPASEAYLVESGQVQIFIDTGHGEKVLTTVGENGLFGEMALIGGGPRTASARACADTVCQIIRADDFQKRFDENDRFRNAVLRLLVESVRRTTDQVGSILRQLRDRERQLATREREYEKRLSALERRERSLDA